MDAGIEIVLCSGEADRYIAHYAQINSDKVCGVLTNDTDLALMADCPMIHCKVFDLNNALKLNTPNMVLCPREIRCKVLTSKMIADHFKINERCLPALSILCGNDFTPSYNYFFYKDIFDNPVPRAVAAFIRHHEAECASVTGFLNIREISEQLYFHYVGVARFSYSFYQSTPVSIIQQGGRNRVPDYFLSSVKSGMVWRNEIEQIDKTRPCIYETTFPVRKLIYCLSQAPEFVTECGQSGDKYSEKKIEIVPFQPNILSSLRDELQDTQKMFFMFYALCENEIPVPNDLEMPAGFDPSLNAVLTCSCLVFARKHHIVTEEHFTPLLLACFSCAIGRMPPPTSSRPGPKGVTIAASTIHDCSSTCYMVGISCWTAESSSITIYYLSTICIYSGTSI